MLSSHLGLVLPSDFFPLGFPTKILYVYLMSSMRPTCSALLIVLNFITRTIFREGTNYEVLHYAIFSIILLLPVF